MTRPWDAEEAAGGTPGCDRVPGLPGDGPTAEWGPGTEAHVVTAAGVDIEPAAVLLSPVDEAPVDVAHADVAPVEAVSVEKSPGEVEATVDVAVPGEPVAATVVPPTDTTPGEEDDWQLPGWIAPGTPFTRQPRTPREVMHALWQTGGQPVLCARRLGCSPRVVLEHIQANRRHWEEANYSRDELFELCAVILRAAVQKMDRWAVAMVGRTEWGQQALAPLPAPEHQWREAVEAPPIQELIPQVLEGLLDERHSIFTRCAARAGGHPFADGADGVAGAVAAGPAPAGDRAGGAGDDLRPVSPAAGD